MKRYIDLLIYIFVLALLTSTAFISMDLLFSKRIEQNQNEDFYRAILTHNNLEFNDDDLFDVFESEIEVQKFYYENKELKVYFCDATKTISFVFGIFDQAGVWGDIIGVMTLDENLEHIVDLSVIQQEEQLGKDVSSRGFLDQFKDLPLNIGSQRLLIIGPLGDENLPYEVDQLAGATKTSDSFEAILIESYFIHKQLLEEKN